MANDDVPERLRSAAADTDGHATREAVCRALTEAFQAAGKLLWTLGYMLGPDRRDGVSPFGFGSDATVGLALVVEIGGELLSGAVTLLSQDNLYSAAALVRQLVEIEYLAWAFAEDQEQAMMWIRATQQERRDMWQPRHLRARSEGRFRATDYHLHCERGGHPTPEATLLLPEHSRRLVPELWWLDLAQHGVSAWRYVMDASDHVGYGDQIRATADAHELPNTITRWEQTDRLLTLLAEDPSASEPF
jgi:hypothetical protein